MAIETRPFDPATYLDTPEAVAAYLNEALATGAPEFVRDALGVIARAEGMTAVAREADLSREHLYRALGNGGNPEFATVMRVVSALGMRLAAKPVRQRRAASARRARVGTPAAAA